MMGVHIWVDSVVPDQCLLAATAAARMVDVVAVVVHKQHGCIMGVVARLDAHRAPLLMADVLYAMPEHHNRLLFVVIRFFKLSSRDLATDTFFERTKFLSTLHLQSDLFKIFLLLGARIAQ